MISEIIIDTREQLPLWTPPGVKVKKLDVGDYTTEVLEGKFHIERKSCTDLSGTILQGHERFKREVERARITGCKLVVYVESPKQAFLRKAFPRGYLLRWNPVTMEKILSTFSLRHNVEFVWCVDRTDMRDRIIARFELEERLHIATLKPQNI